MNTFACQFRYLTKIVLLGRHVNLLKVLLVHLYSFLEILPLACDWYALSRIIIYFNENFCNLVGNVTRSENFLIEKYRYLTLDVKNILLETISHHILPQMLTSPHFNETSDLLNEYLKFADDHSRDSGDLTCLAYRHRNYSRVCTTTNLSQFLFFWHTFMML